MRCSIGSLDSINMIISNLVLVIYMYYYYYLTVINFSSNL
jgi:hypothetical protein